MIPRVILLVLKFLPKESFMSNEERPVFTYDPNEREFTAKAVILGVVMAVILGFANAWLGMKAGMTISAIFPAAVVAIAVFRLPFFKGGALEQNITRTAATVGEALVAGAIFTIPAFIMVNVGGERLWTTFHYWETVGILLIGGLLGIFFIIILRHALCVEAKLPFPESKACAEIVKAGQKGATGSKLLFGAMGVGVLIQLLKDSKGFAIFQESVSGFINFKQSIIRHLNFDKSVITTVNHGGGMPYATPASSPALMGIGYIIGPRLSAINFSGGVLAWLVFIPLILFIDPSLPEKLAVNGKFAGWDVACFSVWYTIIRPIAVGSMFVGGMYTLYSMRSDLFAAIKGAFKKYTPAEGKARARTDIDISVKWIVFSIIALLVPITWIYYHFCGSFWIAVIATIIMTITGFFLCAIGGYLVGMIGGSNQPVSGLTILALLIAAVMMVLLGMTGMGGVAAVLGVAAVVCCATCTSGDLLQDLKVGHIVGGTPWKMEVAQLISVSIVSFVLIFSMIWLHQANLATGGIGGKALPAPQAGLMAQLATGIVSGEMAWGLVFIGMLLSIGLIMIKAPSPMLIAIGMYLPFETTFAIFIGGVFKWISDIIVKKRKLDTAEGTKIENKGILLASGFIAGESITGIILAVLVISFGSNFSITSWLTGKEAVFFYDSWGGWLSIIIFAVVAYALIKIPHGKEKSKV